MRAWVGFPVKNGGVLVLLALLCASSLWIKREEEQTPNLAGCLAGGARAAHTRIAVFQEARITRLLPGHRAEVWEKGLGEGARCVVDAPGPIAVGDWVSLTGEFLPPNRVQVDQFHIHYHRLFKVYVSLPVLVWVGWLLCRTLRPGPAGLAAR